MAKPAKIYDEVKGFAIKRMPISSTIFKDGWINCYSYPFSDGFKLTLQIQGVRAGYRELIKIPNDVAEAFANKILEEIGVG